MLKLSDLCLRFLEPVRRQFGPVRITSGFRTRSVNEQVGGAPLSFHRYDMGAGRGVAADFVARRGTPRAWLQLLQELGPGGLGLYTTFVHVDNRRGQPARW